MHSFSCCAKYDSQVWSVRMGSEELQQGEELVQGPLAD